MKKHTTKILLIGIIEAVVLILTAYFSNANSKNQAFQPFEEELKIEIYEILNTKCNSCHKKQNPFMVFKPKNMEKHASRIHRQVFVEKRMPKGDEFKLTQEESEKLKNWLQPQLNF